MRIAGLHIDGFGIFHDLDLTDLPAGLLVIHGHNEAVSYTHLRAHET